MDKVRLGIIGCGFMGQGVHLSCFLKNKDARVVAVGDLNEKLCRQVAGRFNIEKCYGKAEDLILDAEIDAVALTVPPQKIADLAVESLEKGKHVFTEKPMALRVEEGRRMVESSRRNKRILMGAYMKRYDLGTEYVKKFLSAPEEIAKVGRITYARFHNYNGAWRGQLEPEYIADESRKEYPDLGELRVPDFVREKDRNRYFCSFINFSHDINLMRYLLGDPKGVYASHQRPGPSEYHTFSTTIFEYEDFTATLETGGIEDDYFDETVQVYFEKGWVKLEFPRVLLRDTPARVTIFDNSKGFLTPVLGWGWNFQRQADHFIKCILQNSEPISSGTDSLKDISLEEARYRSYLEKKTIKISY